MNFIKHIMVAVDLSEHAGHALEYAASIAQKFNGHVVLLHAIDGLEYKVKKELNQFSESDYVFIRKQFEDFAEWYLMGHSVEYSIHIQTGGPDQVIKHYDEHNHPDLIVIGMKGFDSYWEVETGSITSSILNKINAPLLIVHNQRGLPAFKRILLLADLSHPNALEEIPLLEQLARTYQSEVFVMNIETHHDLSAEDLRHVTKLLKDIPHYFHSISGENVAEEVKEYILARNINLLAITPEISKPASSKFEGDLTRKLAFLCDIPILSLHVPVLTAES